MLIERIDIESFGALKNIHLAIGSRINVFYGANETGKSTLSAFIKFMFYGFPEPSGMDSEIGAKHRGPQWGDNKTAGSIIVYFREKRYKIEREYSDRDKKKIIDLSTNIAIKDGEEPGEFFFRMNEEVFLKTAFIRQSDPSDIGGEELAEKIRNIIFNADEDVNTKRALEKLNEARGFLMEREKNVGLIFDLGKKKAELEKAFEESVENQHELLNLEGAIKEIEEKMLTNNAKKNELTEELENYKSHNAKQELLKIENLRKQVDTLKAAYDRVIERYAHKDFIPDLEYSRELLAVSQKVREKKAVLSETEARRKSALSRYEEIIERSMSFKKIERGGGIDEVGGEYLRVKRRASFFKAMILTLSVLTVLSAGLLTFLTFYAEVLKGIIIYAPAIPFALNALFIGFARGTKKEITELYKSYEFESENEFAAALDEYGDTGAQIEEYQKELDLCNDKNTKAELEFNRIYGEAKDLLLKWNRSPMSDDRNPDDFVEMSAAASEAAEEIGKAKGIYGQYKMKLDELLLNTDENELKRLAIHARTPNADEKQIVRELEFLIKANEHMHEKEHEIEKNMAVVSSKLPDPAVLSSQLAFIDRKLEELLLKHDALTLAADSLEEACAELKNSVSPRVSVIASSLFRSATGGKYTELSVDPDFGVDVGETAMTKNIRNLSSGTRDTAYICMRMALLDILYEDNLPPLVLDDPFTRFDKTRLEKMCNIIQAISRRAQVFVFTCHEREVSAFREIDATIISM